MSNDSSAASPTYHRMALLIASFMTLIAAGVGFGVRAGILNDWAIRYGFTKVELGTITGGGLVGFGVTIIFFSFLADNLLGYKKLLVLAFVLHVLSVVITLAATPVYGIAGKDATYWCLYIGVFIFALANGVCEAVINPLVATLFPKEKTHYLNILHAGWPAGLIIGGIIGYMFCGDNAAINHLPWEIPLALYMVPTLVYGFMVLKEAFPPSEAAAAGVTTKEMLLQFLSPLLLFLFVIHAMVGYVELGTDSWITNIMENVISGKAFLLFIYTSAIMFVLRFFAGPIVHQINPLGLLFVCAIFGCAGLYWLGSANTGWAILAAATVYGLGKTFFWPTMLGVVGERFPRGGAITMGVMGGIGMLSAGLLGGPGIGYKQDYFATQKMQQLDDALFEEYRSQNKKAFLFFPEVYALDGAKVGVLKDDGAELARRTEIETEEGKVSEETKALNAWWEANKPTSEQQYEKELKTIEEANIYGGRMALKWTAIIPATMGLCYLLLVIYFWSQGGYKQVVLHGEESETEQYTGGVEGPVE
ncbi:Major Facilitator Superfamily protein [Bremerella volcania]|uniref:Major Facilitator Superfamily protein n=1 Tax=Bremerella volcania TaxID=2527984 RepID=A0A518C6Q4_9BACT|nr:MFS transporter [Bremerella volcania]QDU74900.1 Major Facilitator Superfamily protein [Bremerella volcania]